MVWSNHRPDRADYLSKSADIYYATSPDGKKWSDPVAITKNNHTDTIPEVYANLDQSEYFVAWCAPTGTWELPWSALQAQPKRLLGSKPGGYSPRVLPLTGNKCLVVWVAKSENGLQIYGCELEK